MFLPQGAPSPCDRSSLPFPAHPVLLPLQASPDLHTARLLPGRSQCDPIRQDIPSPSVRRKVQWHQIPSHNHPDRIISPSSFSPMPQPASRRLYPFSYVTLHTLRSLKPQYIDTILQNLLREYEQRNITLLLSLVFFRKDLRLMVETIKSICQIIDKRTDLMRR